MNTTMPPPGSRPTFGRKPVTENAIDAIDSLPLSIIPLKTNSLKSAKLVKNARMETMIELFHDPVAGSLMIEPSRLSETYGNKEDVERDQEILMQLSELPSYDVYSLRGTLRKLGLETVPVDALELSDDMKDALATYTGSFIRPVIMNIYGKEFLSQGQTKNLMDIFKGTDSQVVMGNLSMMSQKTGIPVDQIPDFLQKYSDTFLSIAYFRFTYDTVLPEVQRCIEWLDETKSYRDIKAMPGTYQGVERMQRALTQLSTAISARMDKLNRSFEAFWADINQESFNRLQLNITNNYPALGAILCGLSVKMKLWSNVFPNNAAGNPHKRGTFVKTELEPGVDALLKIEQDNVARGL